VGLETGGVQRSAAQVRDGGRRLPWPPFYQDENLDRTTPQSARSSPHPRRLSSSSRLPSERQRQLRRLDMGGEGPGRRRPVVPPPILSGGLLRLRHRPSSMAPKLSKSKGMSRTYGGRSCAHGRRMRQGLVQRAAAAGGGGAASGGGRCCLPRPRHDSVLPPRHRLGECLHLYHFPLSDLYMHPPLWILRWLF
jgi:hypothetical protein